MKSKLFMALFASVVLSANLSAQCTANIAYALGPGPGMVTFWTDSLPQDTLNAYYLWTFGDNTGGSGSHTSHQYSQAGTTTYSVCITKYDTVLSCSHTTCDSVTVTGSSSCSTSLPSSHQDSLYTYTASATGTAPFYYSWTINSAPVGDSATTSVSAIQPDTAGAVVVICLTITDATGCQSSACAYLTDSSNTGGGGNGGNCSTYFTYTNIDSLYTMTPTSSGAAPYTYNWTINGLNAGTTPTITTVIAQGSSDYVCVTVTDSSGCVANSCYSIYDTLPGGSGSCSATIHFTNQDSLFMFQANSTGQPPFTFSWTLNNGTPINSDDTAYFIIPSDSNYVVCVTITDANGCIASACTNAGSTCSTYIGYTNVDSVFTFTSSHIGYTPVSYSWTYGNNGQIGTSNTLVLNLDSAALYAGAGVCLTITDASGCVSSACVNIPGDSANNLGSCQAYFTVYADSINGQDTSGTYNAYNLSTGNYGSNILWNFGDGTTSNDPYPVHSYAVAGTYIVCLTVGTYGTSCYSTYCDSSFYVSRSLVLMNTFEVIPPLGINEVASASGISIYPNPVSNELNIRSATKIDQERIFDITGQQVFGTKACTNAINVSNLSTGVYILEVTTGGQVSRTKFIKE